jgi:signal peptidase I
MDNDSELNPILAFLKNVYFKFLDVSQTILFGASFLLVVYIFVLQPHQVSGSSMFPTFKDQELLFSYLLDVQFHNLHRGDVVVFHAPPVSEADKLYIKRIIAISGDSIRVEGGLVYLNNKRLDESAYLKPDVPTYGGSSLKDGETKIIPTNNYFVMGDNRPYSSDSRAWGFVTYSKLIGRSAIRFWPFNAFTIIKRNPYKQ